MKRYIGLTVILAVLLCACAQNKPHSPEATHTLPTTTEAAPTETVATQPLHSQLYIPGVSVEDVIRYFNEVCLDSEFVNSGDPSVVQKWAVPISYTLNGDYTQEDLATLGNFEDWLNGIEGFPGISRTDDPARTNLRIHFCTQADMPTLMGPNFVNMDGAVTFWYDNDRIYNAIICYRTDLDQQLRNSVILEEIYNSLGPIQDTTLRPDSIIYQEFSQPQWLSPMDELILRLLYHPDIQPGMNA